MPFLGHKTLKSKQNSSNFDVLAPVEPLSSPLTTCTRSPARIFQVRIMCLGFTSFGPRSAKRCALLLATL